MSKDLRELECTVRYGSGVCDGGEHGRRLAEQLGTAHVSPNVMTMLGTIKELQDSLDAERQRQSQMERRHEREIEPLRPQRSTVLDAERALSYLARGQCCSHTNTPYAEYWTDGTRTHPGMEAGYHVRRLPDELALGRATLEDALQAVIELCTLVDELHHRIEGR